ncbi:hypothetical protein [Saprospira grandis]|uniref:hypothetical protein n=1 Tax=Saprospira grandis TaxID=1008 RepID=UPI0022DE73BC|nr:hypothetical protein [Saprospira grandis]WBM74310.1 hypothetical protein OP864_15095 [Saprospira grandis]
MDDRSFLMQGEIKFVKKFNDTLRLKDRARVVIYNPYYLGGHISIYLRFKTEVKTFKLNTIEIVEFIVPFIGVFKEPIQPNSVFSVGTGFENFGELKYLTTIGLWEDSIW